MTSPVPERLVVQVGSVLWSGGGATVFGGKTADGEAVRVVGKGRTFQPVAGEVYEVEGEWHVSARHGRQFYGDASRFRRKAPSGRLVVPWLQRIPGVGPKRAKDIHRHYKRRLDGVFDGGVPLEELAGVIDPQRPNLAIRVAVAIMREWQEVKGEYEAVRWLEEHGIEDVATAIRIARLLGPEAVRLVERNPYVLATVLPWPKVDPLAKRLLRGRADVEDHLRCPERLVGAIDVVVQAAVREGHTAVPKAGFEDLVAERLDLRPTPALAAAVLRAGVANRAVVDGGDRWRAPGCAVMEEDLAARFGRMAAGGECCRVRVPQETDLRRILRLVERQGRELHSEQREAVLATLRRPLACLTGGAGTGKTTTCRAIVDLWEALGGHVQMAALSGKAALRLSEGTGRTGPGARPALTIYRLLLGLRKRTEGETHWGRPPAEGEEPDPARELPELTDRTLLVIDEASMVDLGQMHEVVEAMPPGCRLLLVGDAFQLAPVGFGLVFHHLAAQAAVTARLETVRRQEDASGIPAVSRVVRACRVPDLPAYRPGMRGVSFLAAADGEIGDLVERVAGDLGGHAGRLSDLMVVSPVNHRPGRPDGTVRDLNRRLHLAALARRDLTEEESEAATVKGYFGNLFSVGDPVTFLRNDYELGLRNGSLGRVVSIDPEAGSVTCDFDGEEVSFADRDQIDLALAYAVTCHRAQGSQARSVIVALLDAPNVDPTWVYTALTRAEETAVIVGTSNVLERALGRTPAHARRLTGCTFDLGSTPAGKAA
ncbi:MAG TPA: AAA family ATPase [Microvirga sp.]